MSTAIKSGTVVTADMPHNAEVLIEGEKMVAIGDNLSGDTTLDACGCYIMPGGMDPHRTAAASLSRVRRTRRSTRRCRRGRR
jgi:dihydroorotase-like cyclic amidohydrolase